MTPESVLPILDTPRLRLRPLLTTDAEGLHGAFGDPAAMRFWDSPVSRDVTETAQRIQWALRFSPDQHAAWAVLSKHGPSFLGMVNYHHWEPWNRRLEVGYILARPFWGQGLMSEAMSALLGHCFGRLGVHRVEASIEPANLASIRLAERLGFRRESGLLRDRILVGGQFRSVLLYGLVDADWLAQGGGGPPFAHVAGRYP
ncbi:MAG: GNAT family N-acetyltransferase [Pseudomonadota bacterium]|nr:GNAT family N-acetyltransferase [Pseudomonadota bacterium]